MKKHVRVVGPMNGKFTFQKCTEDTIDKVGVIWLLCKKEFAYHLLKTIYYFIKPLFCHISIF